MNSQDKLKTIFPNKEDVFKMFHINFKTGQIYRKDFWDRDIHKEIGRPTTDKEYRRVNVNCPHLTHIFKRGYIDVSAHRLIYYAHTGELPEKVDHDKKDAEYLDGIANLRRSDAVHNRANTKKIKRKNPSGRKRISEKYIGIYKAYKFYWTNYKNRIVNEKGFVSEILAANFWNKFAIKQYEKGYKDRGIFDFPPFPKSGLNLIDSNDLFLEQMTQEAVEKTEDYKLRQKEIKKEKQQRSDMISQRKLNNKISIKVEDDPFYCIGRYDT